MCPQTSTKTPQATKTQIEAIFISAMSQETTAFLAEFTQQLQLTHPQAEINTQNLPSVFEPSVFESAQKISVNQLEYLILTSGIGMVNAAAALSTALTHFAPKIVICVGSAGGLHQNARVQDVVIGTAYINSRADATAFGYAPGQVPGSPAMLEVGTEITTAVCETLSSAKTKLSGINVYAGQMLSSDAFVTDTNVASTRSVFPDGLSADMESQAYAQVAGKFANTPFVAVRGISDLCGTPEDQSISFHAELSDVASRAAKVALEICANFTKGVSQSSSDSL